ncbi:MAG: hypothetical protein CME65_05420 [Halobacteriovoraceae bacterium]|nr:hypothetical protein [Halobacteriovoraceae bacterium]|tara:strand:- start:9739 stop:10701 length:963 start_codon:yes stop_codon:yes gene_type:complete
MDLCVIAHRGEAQAFTKGLKAVTSHYYQGEEFSVLICGEGVFEASKLGSHLGSFERVLNFGIAGALNKKIVLGTIHPIRTHYLHLGEAPEFKSYTPKPEQTYDCITSFERVLSSEKAYELYQFADIVDREAWLFAKICADASIPFESYKLISDYAGENTNCFDIKEKALEYSEELFSYYQELKTHKMKGETQIELNLPGSFTQKKRLSKILKALSFKEDCSIDEVLLKNPLPKLKSEINQYIDDLNQKLNPIQVQIQEKINSLQKPFDEIGAKIIFDPKLEKKKFRIQMEINDQKNIDNLNSLLSRTHFSEFENLWNGDV